MIQKILHIVTVFLIFFLLISNLGINFFYHTCSHTDIIELSVINTTECNYCSPSLDTKFIEHNHSNNREVICSEHSCCSHSSPTHTEETKHTSPNQTENIAFCLETDCCSDSYIFLKNEFDAYENIININILLECKLLTVIKTVIKPKYIDKLKTLEFISNNIPPPKIIRFLSKLYSNTIPNANITL